MKLPQAMTITRASQGWCCRISAMPTRWHAGSPAADADAEDVVQDACLRAFRGLGSIGDGSARPWVPTIVRNTAYTWLRKNRPPAVLVVEDLQLFHIRAMFEERDHVDDVIVSLETRKEHFRTRALWPWDS